MRKIVNVNVLECYQLELAFDDGKSGVVDNPLSPPSGPGWVMSKVLENWDGQTPARQKRLDDYLKAGRFQFHALPFTLASDACEPEEMARGFGFSSALCRKYGMPLPRSGKMTDVPSHGGALATVLAHGGVKFMHIGCNWPSGCVITPGLFWWEGPDGSRVLTFYSNTYGTCVPPWMPRWYSAEDPLISTILAPSADWPYAVWPAILVTPDNSGPPKADQITASNLQALAGAVKHDGPGMVVFNPLPWTRSGTVEMKGESVFVKDVPPCGYRALPLPPAITRTAPRKTTEPATIGSAFFKLTLDPAQGAITSLVDKRTGREWVEPSDGGSLGQYLNERFTFEQTHQYSMKSGPRPTTADFCTKATHPPPLTQPSPQGGEGFITMGMANLLAFLIFKELGRAKIRHGGRLAVPAIQDC